MNICMLVAHSILVILNSCLTIFTWINGNKIASILWGMTVVLWFAQVFLDIAKIMG